MAFLNPYKPTEPERRDTPAPAEGQADKKQFAGFPVDVFPQRLRRIVSDCNAFLGYHPDYTAAALLAAASTAIGATYRVQYVWDDPSSLYLVIVGKPGRGKSHPIKFAFAPIRRHDSKSIDLYTRQMDEYQKDPSVGRPTLKQIVYGDTTIEAFISGITKNPRGISIVRDELAGFFKNFGRYTNNSSEVETWLEIWTGAALNMNRSGKAVYIPNPTVTIFGGIQDGIIEQLARNDGAVNGFVERFLFVKPERVEVTKIKKRGERQNSDFSAILTYWTPVVDKILSLTMATGEDGRPDSHYLTFDEKTEDMLTDWINAIKDRLDKEQNDNIANIYAKIQNYVLRFALVLQVLHHATGEGNLEGVTEDNARRAMRLAEYFLEQSIGASKFIFEKNAVDNLPEDVKGFYRSLPDEFPTANAVEEGARMGFTAVTVKRHLSRWTEKKFIRKDRHGEYTKVLF